MTFEIVQEKKKRWLLIAVSLVYTQQKAILFFKLCVLQRPDVFCCISAVNLSLFVYKVNLSLDT